MSELPQTVLELSASRRWCHEFSRRHAKHFSLAFALMPRPKRQAMEAVYTFCQLADQAVDEGPKAERATRLRYIRATLDRIVESSAADPAAPWSAALIHAIECHNLDVSHFYDLLRGMQMDLDRRRYQDWPELEDYCWHVAGVVGLCVVEILGCHSDKAASYARELGLALQLINILRDVREDALEGRIYLPQVLLDAHDLSDEDLATERATSNLRAALMELADRAEQHYRMADELLTKSERKQLRLARLIGEAYYPLLGEIRARNFDVFSSRARLTNTRKLLYILRGFWRCRS